MSIQFDNEPVIINNPKSKKFSISDKLIDWGIATDRKSAERYLMGASIIFFCLSIYITFF